jgi:hypothetical protein
MTRQGTAWHLLALGFCGLLATVQACPAQDVSPLRGEVFVAGRTPVDPPPEEPKNSHTYMTVSGPAAMRMYGRSRLGKSPISARRASA